MMSSGPFTPLPKPIPQPLPTMITAPFQSPLTALLNGPFAEIFAKSLCKSLATTTTTTSKPVASQPVIIPSSTDTTTMNNTTIQSVNEDDLVTTTIISINADMTKLRAFYPMHYFRFLCPRCEKTYAMKHHMKNHLARSHKIARDSFDDVLVTMEIYRMSGSNVTAATNG